MFRQPLGIRITGPEQNDRRREQDGHSPYGIDRHHVQQHQKADRPDPRRSRHGPHQQRRTADFGESGKDRFRSVQFRLFRLFIQQNDNIFENGNGDQHRQHPVDRQRPCRRSHFFRFFCIANNNH